MNRPSPEGRLVFIYHARSGTLQAVLDLLHKTFFPGTYRCDLCRLTYTYRMRQPWRDYLASLPWEIQFRYADQLDDDLRKLAGPLPCCLLEKGADRRLLLDADMISQCQDVAGLIEMLEKELARL
jgi:hypothetical protein